MDDSEEIFDASPIAEAIEEYEEERRLIRGRRTGRLTAGFWCQVRRKLSLFGAQSWARQVAKRHADIPLVGVTITSDDYFSIHIFRRGRLITKIRKRRRSGAFEADGIDAVSLDGFGDHTVP